MIVKGVSDVAYLISNKVVIKMEKKVKRQRSAITKEEEVRILGFLFEGRTPFSISKLVGRDRGVIVRIARRHQKELSSTMLERLKMGNIEDGLTEYNRYLKSEKRQELLSVSMDRLARNLSRESLPAKDIRDLTVSLGILIDKFAVEVGKTDDDAKAGLIAMFQRMEQNFTVNNNGTTCTNGKASEVHTVEAESNEYTVGELEERKVDSS